MGISKNLITIPDSTSVEKSLMIMKSHNFRHLPVVNEADEIVGIVSDRDLYKSLSCDETDLKKIMIKNPLKVDVRSDIRDVLRKMIEHKISSFLVTENTKTIGIITSEDLLYMFLQSLGEEGSKKSLLQDLISSVLEANQAVKNPNIIVG